MSDVCQMIAEAMKPDNPDMQIVGLGTMTAQSFEDFAAFREKLVSAFGHVFTEGATRFRIARVVVEEVES